MTDVALSALPSPGISSGLQPVHLHERLPELQLIYDTAPIGLAFLTPDCRYVQINQRLTEICGISVSDHIGRTVRETVPQVADQVETIVDIILRTGEPVQGIEVNGQRADKRNADHIWITNWHPLKGPDGTIVGINVVAEDVTDRKRAEAELAASEKALRESEGRFRELADNMNQFAWAADRSGQRYWYNKRWYDYSGTTFEEMKGWGWQKLHHPDHLNRVVTRIRESFEIGVPWEDTFPLRGKDGNYRWFLSRAQPIRNEAGEVVRWLGTNTDITAQIEAEKALRELNETLEHRVETETHERLQIWNVSQDLLVISNLAGQCLSLNPAWTATLGWSEQELLSESPQWLVHPDDRKRTRAETEHVAGGGTALFFENRLRHKDGSYRWISWKAVADQGRIYAMGRDVTELRDAEDRLHDARRELSHVNRTTTMATMAASIAHEIRQPLGAIVANANAGLRWLNKTPPGLDEARETFGDIVADGHRASEVVQSIRAMFNRSEPKGRLLRLNGLIHETIAIARGDLKSANITVQTALAAQLPAIDGHKGQLQQVVLNIVTNAIDAMRSVADRERVLKVKSALSPPDHVELSIEDTGTGIHPDDMERIFDTFFTTKSTGMGMGLAICRSIVEAHGGTLSVYAREPHGSVFRIVLPRNQ